MIPSSVSPFANHLWQSTVFAAAVWLLTLALRQNRAQVRYRLWLAASVKFLLPFSLLLRIGQQFEWQAAPSLAPPLSALMEQFSQPFGPALPTVAASVMPAPSSLLPGLLALAWLGGCLVVVSRWWVRWRPVRAAVRRASRLPVAAPVAVLSSATPLEPGIFGVFRPVLLLPEGLADRLTAAQFKAILAHEFCHVRRRDNLAAALHMVVEAAFWFHPLVWWIGGRLVEERECACDEEVLQQGSDPEVYAAGILNVCKFYLESPLPCGSGVTGADLKKRVEAIMLRRVLWTLSPARKLLLAAAGLAAVGGPIALGILHQDLAHGQSAAPLRFEVASLKPSKSVSMKGYLDVLPGGGLRMDGVTLLGLISFAYHVQETQISGGPRWADSVAYDLLAKAERPAPADTEATTVAPGTTGWERLRQRLQVLLQERFHLVIRQDSKEAPGYKLVTAPNGTRLKQSPNQAPAGTMRGLSGITGRNGTMEMLAAVLTNFLGRPVANRTGLTGTYDYKLEYAPDPGPGRGPGADAADANLPDLGRPTLFAALEEQLGLKLVTAKVPVESIVIVRAEQPSEN